MSSGAAPYPDYTPIVDDSSPMARTPDQVACEAAMREVSETLLNIEQAVRRADRAHRAVAARSDDGNIALALRDALTALKATHKTLFQTTYFGDDQQRLI